MKITLIILLLFGFLPIYGISFVISTMISAAMYGWRESRKQLSKIFD